MSVRVCVCEWGELSDVRRKKKTESKLMNGIKRGTVIIYVKLGLCCVDHMHKRIQIQINRKKK